MQFENRWFLQCMYQNFKLLQKNYHDKFIGKTITCELTRIPLIIFFYYFFFLSCEVIYFSVSILRGSGRRFRRDMLKTNFYFRKLCSWRFQELTWYGGWRSKSFLSRDDQSHFEEYTILENPEQSHSSRGTQKKERNWKAPMNYKTIWHHSDYVVRLVHWKVNNFTHYFFYDVYVPPKPFLLGRPSNYYGWPSE